MLSTLVALVVLGAATDQTAPREKAIATARASLARQAGLAVEAIETVEAGPAEWPDASLGCPQEGRMYAQVLTRGYRVVLRSGAAIQVVHVSGDTAVHCGRPLLAAPSQPRPAEASPDAALPEPEAPAQQALVARAREDLARRLSIAPGDVSLEKFEEVVWPDRGFGCPRPGVAHPQVPQDGVRIVLRAAGRRYQYHAGAGRPPFLCESAGHPKPR